MKRKRKVSILLCLVLMLSGMQFSVDLDAASMKLGFGEVWSVPTTVKVLQNQTDYTEKDEAKLNYQMVRNEYESYQLFITATQDIQSFQLQKSDLKYGNHTLSADHVDIYVQKYVYYNDTCGEGYAPDPLIPMEAALSHKENQIRSGNNGGLWVTVYAPKETVAGLYTGTFKLLVESKGKTYEQDIPVSVKVYDYTLTDNVNAKTLFSWRYNQVAAGEQDGSTAMMTRYYEFFRDYRISLQALPLEALTAEEYIEAVLKYYDEITTYSLHCYVGSISGELDRYPELVKEQILAIAEACTSERNLFEKAMIYFIDEPKLEEAGVRKTVISRISAINGYLEECINTISADKTGKYNGLKQIRNWETSIREIPNIIPVHDAPIQWLIANQNTEEGKQLLNSLNCLCPIYYNFYDGNREKLEALCTSYGIEVWWYGCAVSDTPYPTYFVGDTNLLSSRTVSWLQKEYHVEGNLYWDIAGYTLDAPYGYNPQLFEWPDRDTTGGLPAGDGNLVYPGAKYGVYGPLPSLRLMSIRDGMEEYELLLDIENYYKQNKSSFDSGFSVDAAMEALYSSLEVDGIKMCADGENGLDFVALREKLLQLAEGKGKGLVYAISDISYSGNQFTGYYANFTCYVPSGSTATFSGVQSSSKSGNAYTVKSNRMAGDTYVTITVSKGNQSMTYIQYVGSKTSWFNTSATTTDTEDVTNVAAEYVSTTLTNQSRDAGVLFSFDSYDEIAGTHVFMGNQFGRTSINTDANYVKEGSASWKVEPQGNYTRPSQRPYFSLYCSDTDSTLTSQFSQYDKLMLDVYNASDEEIVIYWDFAMSNILGEKVTARKEFALKANAWTTCEFWLNSEEYENYYCLDTVTSMQVIFLNGKESREDTVDTLYIDNLRGEILEAEAIGVPYADIYQYRKGNVYTYPQKEGYVFGGWYADANLTVPLDVNTNSGSAFAKFVDENVLSVKCQIIAGADITDKEASIRMLTTVDSLNYKEVGFSIGMNGKVAERSTTVVYKSINGYVDGNKQSYAPSVFSEKSAYFAAFTLWNVPNAYFNELITIVPTWTTLDGTVVTGCEKKTTIAVGITGGVVITNPTGANAVRHTFDLAAKKDEYISFDVDVTPAQSISVWLLGTDMRVDPTWKNEWYAQRYDEWTGKTTIQVPMPSDVENFTITVGYNDNDAEQAHKNDVVTISNVKVVRDRIEVNEDGSIVLQNNVSGKKTVQYTFEQSVEKNKIISFDVDVTPAQDISVWLLGDGMWSDEWYAKQYKVWTGKTTIAVTIPEDTSNFTIVVAYNDTNQDFKANEVTIFKPTVREGDVVENADGSVTIYNTTDQSSVKHTFNRTAKKGQIITFKVDVSPAQKATVWFFGSKTLWTNEWFGKQYNTELTNQIIAVEIKEDITDFTVLVRFDDTSKDWTQNVVNISEVTIRDSGVVSNADGSMTVYNGSGARNVLATIATGDYKVGDAFAFDIDFNMDEAVAIYVRGKDASGNNITGESMYAAAYIWNGKQTITTNAIGVEGVKEIEVFIQYRKHGTQTELAEYKDNVATISNVKINNKIYLK